MVTTAEKIKVMQAFEDGKAIQEQPFKQGPWEDRETKPPWSWDRDNYRIKPADHFKELTTHVPNWATKLAVDAGGEIYVFAKKPIYGGVRGWVSTNRFMCIGQGPRPKDASKEIYDLVE